MRNFPFLGVSLLALVAGGPAFAQEAPQNASGSSVASEEIIVTATKREQTLQDVPISVAVTSQETIERSHIHDLIDLQNVVPSLRVAQLNAVGQTNFIIRGFGNGAGNDGIESSVGVFVDGVYRSRTSSALDDLPEVQRIEVLRGPQSTLFGKNVSAGAISIVTQRPQFDFGGTAEMGFGNFGLIETRGSVTGPITDTLAFRFSASGTVRDGVMHNVVTGNDVNDRDRWSTRGDLLWQPTDHLSVRVIADYNQISEACCGTVQVQNGPASTFVIAPFLGPINNPATKFNRDIVFNTDPQNFLIGQGISGQVDWDMGFATLTSITADRRQTNRSVQDVDFTGADLANKDQRSRISTFTQEFRLASNGQGPLHWLLGAFYQDETLDTGVATSFGTQLRSFANIAGQSTGGTPNITLLETLLGRPAGSFFRAGDGINDFYTMDQTAYSVFGQADFDVTDRLTLTAGAAYLSDRKDARSNVVLTDQFSQLNLATTFGGAFAGLNPLQFFYGDTTNHAPVNFPNASESGRLDGDKVTYALRAAYDFDLFNAYVSYSTGWKAGAFNLSSDSRPPDASGIGRTADPENVTLYELGVKSNFHGGFVNVAVFDQAIEGFQSNIYTGTAFALVNAGKESVRGAEIDSAYQPFSWLGLTGAVTYLDPKYDSFTHAPCVSFDPVACPLGVRGFRDLSGERPGGIPTWTVSASATLSREFGNGYGAYLRAEYDYTSDTYLVDNTPRNVSTYGNNNVNLSLGLTNQPQNIELMFWARNLTDHDTIIATFPTVAQDGSYSGFTNQPRTYGVTLRKRF